VQRTIIGVFDGSVNEMTQQSKAPSVEGFKKLSFWREESVGIVTFLSPGLMDYGLLEELIQVFSIAAVDDKVSSLILTGSNFNFSKGIVVPENRSYADLRDYYKRVQSLVLFWVSLEKPIFSALNGTATNNGVSIALLADEVFLSENSRVILNEEEPTIFLGSLTIPQRVISVGDSLRIKGVEVGKENMMEDVFNRSKLLRKLGYHRSRRQKFPELDRTLLQEEIDFLDFYLWCEGCRE
jgi:hypothetical protein